MEKIIHKRSQIIHDIIDFYQLQPGVQAIHIEKIEEYLILVDAFFKQALLETFECDEATDLFDVLNSYINAITEEHEKIFPDKVLDIYPIEINDENLNELQIFEALQRFNLKDRFHIQNLLQEIEKYLFDDEFCVVLNQIIQQLICSINAEMFVKVDDLI